MVGQSALMPWRLWPRRPARLCHHDDTANRYVLCCPPLWHNLNCSNHIPTHAAARGSCHSTCQPWTSTKLQCNRPQSIHTTQRAFLRVSMVRQCLWEKTRSFLFFLSLATHDKSLPALPYMLSPLLYSRPSLDPSRPFSQHRERYCAFRRYVSGCSKMRFFFRNQFYRKYNSNSCQPHSVFCHLSGVLGQV